MELNWSTFGLEILNFLVLVWILKALLFKPVMATIERRRAAIQTVLAEAGEMRAEAETMKAELQDHLARWEREKQDASEKLRHELEEQRRQRLALLEQELTLERQKSRVLEDRQRQEEQRKLHESALELGSRFTTRLLGELAGPELESQLVELGLRYLDSLPPQALSGQAFSRDESAIPVQISSAYPLSPQIRSAIEEKLGRLMNTPLACEYREDRELMAGIHISARNRTLAFNLRDELRGFSECWQEGG